MRNHAGALVVVRYSEKTIYISVMFSGDLSFSMSPADLVLGDECLRGLCG